MDETSQIPVTQSSEPPKIPVGNFEEMLNRIKQKMTNTVSRTQQRLFNPYRTQEEILKMKKDKRERDARKKAQKKARRKQRGR